jgi:arsenite methyltransferase
MKSANLYESPVLRAVTGPTLRPGGLDLTRRALSFCAFSAAGPVLDVGCGEGATTAFLAHDRGFPAIGLDLSTEMLRSARQQNKGLKLIRARAEAIPIAEASMQGVFCECVLSLLPDPLAGLKEFHRLLSPGGYLILTDIYSRTNQTDPFLRRIPINTCLKGAVSQAEIEGMVREGGFNQLLWEDHSESLKQWMGQMIFAFGSMEAFWRSFIYPFNPSDLQCALKNTKPGYYLLIAQKEDQPHG